MEFHTSVRVTESSRNVVRRMPKEIINYINHVAFLLDESSSMYSHKLAVPKVVDGQISYLAQRSKELDQDTRVTVYTFSTRFDGQNVRCRVFDTDVLRVPSIAGLYQPSGSTPLIEASLLMLDDLAQTFQKYGDHSFLAYALTDGQENVAAYRSPELLARLNSLPDNWTVAGFVPDQVAKAEAMRFGFPKDNLAVWDVDNKRGVEEIGETIRRSTDTFMQARAAGVKSTRSLFVPNTVTPKDIQGNLVALTRNSYTLNPVLVRGRIDEFVQSAFGKPYIPGKAYFQLTKPETIQPAKAIAIRFDKDVYTGAAARKLLGLPDVEIKVKPGDHPGYTIFVQSSSYNRVLLAGTELLVLR